MSRFLRVALRRLAPGGITIRLRLTLVYGGIFLLAGVLLLGVTYVLLSHQLPDEPANLTRIRLPPVDATPGGAGGVVAPVKDATPATDVQFVRELVAGTRSSALSTLATQGVVALVVVFAAVTAFGWLVAGRVLQPLARMTETARRIAEAPAADRGLHERVALVGPSDEVKELADTFDLMLERLDDSFDSQRRFIANASHELRTPLTVNRTLLEVALEPEDTSPEVRQLGTTLLAVNARHAQLIDGLLLLASSEREILEKSYVDLADIVEHVVDQYADQQSDRQQGADVLVKAEAEEAPTSGNPVLLERLVQNLVENGVRHNISGGWVHVSTASGPSGQTVLQVSNTGPVVPRYEVPALFEPFYRLGSDRLATASGVGLGLSIVRAIAQAHGGVVEAEPREGGGLVVTVTLPAP